MNHRSPSADSSPRADFFRSLNPDVFPFGLGSDNHSGAHPRLLKALEWVNSGFAPSYGTDVVTEEAIKIFRLHFGDDVDVHFCFNGTAANVLALAPFVRSYNAILCSDVAHINVDECGAAEKLLGTKLIPVATQDGKLTPSLLAPLLIRRGDQHFAQANTVSITQPTEFGTVYSKEELKNLRDFCRTHGLWLHMDGARFINSVAALGCSPRDVVDGVDSLSFGGTKNGLVFGEAVLFLSPRAREAAREFQFIRKQFMQLPSKTRYIAGQFVELMGSDLWKEISQHSCARARELRAGLESLRQSSLGQRAIRLTQTTDANAIFVCFDRELEKVLKKSAFFYVWNEETRECRLMTSWSTTSDDVNRFIQTARDWLASQSGGRG